MSLVNFLFFTHSNIFPCVTQIIWYLLTTFRRYCLQKCVWINLAKWLVTGFILKKEIFEWSPPWHSIWHILWHSIWHSIWDLFCHSLWHSIRHSIWHSIWHVALAIEVPQCPLSLRSGSRSWSPAVPTKIRPSRLRSGSPADIWPS